MTEIVIQYRGGFWAMPFRGEEWRKLQSPYRAYEVSSYGRIRRRGRCLKGSFDRNGYHRVSLYQCGMGKTIRVHRLVCEAFHGPPPKGTEVAHLDGDCRNNTAANLAWVTHRENVGHQKHHGTFVSPRMPRESHPNARLTELDIDEIRRSPEASRKLAKKFGVSQPHIVRIKNGDRW